MSDQARSEERENAELNSRSCILCDGNGIVLVFHRDWSGNRIGTRNGLNPMGEPAKIPFAAEVAAHCICPLGRWMRDKTPEFLKKRIPDGAAIVGGRSWYSFDHPELDREHDDEQTEAPPSRQQINAMFRRPA